MLRAGSRPWQAVVRLSRGKTARAGGWSIAGQLTAVVAGAANFLLLARLVGPAEYGIVAAVWALVLTTGPIATLGAERLIARDAAVGREPPAAALGAALTTSLTGATAAVVLLVVLQPLLLPQAPRLLLAAVAVADIVALSVIGCLSALCFATGRARAAGLMMTLVSLSKLLAVLVFAATGSDDAVTWALLYGGFSVASAAGHAVWGWRRFGRPYLRSYSLRARAREGLPYSANIAVLAAQNDADKLLLVRFGYVAEAGLYTVAYRLALMASLPVLAVLQSTLPRFFALGEGGGLPATAAFGYRLLRYLAAYAVLATLGLILVAPVIPMLVGEAFEDAVPLVMLLAALPIVRVAHAVPADALTGAGRQSARTACVAVSAAVNITVNLALIPNYGVAAAVFATFVSELVLVVLANVVLRRGLRAARQQFAQPQE